MFLLKNCKYKFANGGEISSKVRALWLRNKVLKWRKLNLVQNIVSITISTTNLLKLDGVRPVDRRPSTNKLHNFVKKEEERKKVLHVTCDTWHVTCDRWHRKGWGSWTFSQNFSSLAFPVWEWRSFEDIFTKDELLTEWLTDWLTDLMTKVFVERPQLHWVW